MLCRFIYFILYYKFTLSDLSMMREVNLLNRGNANLFVPKSEVLSTEATLSNLISLGSTFSLINISARSRCLIPRVRCGISDAYTQAWLSSSMIVASWGNPMRFNIPFIARASSFKHWFTALISDSAVDVDKLPWVLLVKLTTLWWPMYPTCALVEYKPSITILAFLDISDLNEKSQIMKRRRWPVSLIHWKHVFSQKLSNSLMMGGCQSGWTTALTNDLGASVSIVMFIKNKLMTMSKCIWLMPMTGALERSPVTSFQYSTNPILLKLWWISDDDWCWQFFLRWQVSNQIQEFPWLV